MLDQIIAETQVPAPTGAATLDAAAQFLDRFVAWPSPAARDAAVLWAAHTHCTDRDRVLVFASTPRLAFLSDEPASGKTFAMERVASLSARPVMCTDPTAPALAKIIAEQHATVAIDEIDLLLRKGTAKQEVRTILNAGYARSGTVLRSSGQVRVFGPVALAGLDVAFTTSPLLRATYSRSIVVRMLPAAPGAVEDYRERMHDGAAAAIAAALEAWVLSELGPIAEAWPDMPEGIRNRDADIWEPLIILGDAAGGDWPARARAACLELTARTEATAPAVSPAERLPADLRAVWAGEDRLSSATIIGRLVSLRGAPWAQLWPHPELAGRELAALLAPHSITPVKVRIDGRPLQGYTAEQLSPLWSAGTPATA
jgi:hypothetical protein